MKLNFAPWVAALHLVLFILVSHARSEEEPFRPEPGQFPPIEKAHTYRGELVFVDHANRRGSIRVQSEGMYYRIEPHPFAMLPFGMIRYRGAPADLRDIPLGTVLHVHAFLPPDPTTSPVPVMPISNKDKGYGYRGNGIFPAENHVLLLEDEISHCRRQGKVWVLKQLHIENHAGTIIARRVPAGNNDAKAEEETMTFDAATRIWRGRESLDVADLIAEDIWPAEGHKTLTGQTVQLGIMWKPTPKGVFTRFHISDIWLDDTAIQRATRSQNETHKAFVRSRWMPGWVDAVEYGTFGQAIVTVTLFGGMDDALYANFTKGISAMMNSVENTLKHAGGNYGPAHMASRGTILEVTKADGKIPLGSSGIRIQFQTDLIIEGIRPSRVIRICPGNWPQVNLPREEFIGDGNNPASRFPTPEIFPKY